MTDDLDKLLIAKDYLRRPEVVILATYLSKLVGGSGLSADAVLVSYKLINDPISRNTFLDMLDTVKK